MSMYFMGTRKVVVTLSIAVGISSKMPSSVWKMNGDFVHILLKKNPKPILNLNLHESLDVTISYNFHFDRKIVYICKG